MSKKLYRSKSIKTLAGVCGGLAEYFDIDVTIVRLIWVAFFFLSAGFPTIFAYAIAALIIPEEPDSNKRNKENYDNIYYTVHKGEEE